VEHPELTFVIPAHRLCDAGETIEHHDQHYWRNGHTVSLMVFDHASPANQQKYFALPEQTRTHNDLDDVGPCENEQFLPISTAGGDR
jgi:hypothetical protein